MAKPSPIRQRTVPQFGRIEGGLLDGWSFALLEVTARGPDIYLGARVTPPTPDWPFPREVDLHGRRDFKKLANLGQVAAEHDSEKLIQAAREAATT